jgi:clan AA aspartic protease (TIGR02281 family)
MPEYPLKSDSGVIILEVSLISRNNRIIPLKMVLDTGASLTTVPLEAAIAIGCDPAKSKKRVEMITASGTEYAPVVTIPKIRFLNFELKNVTVICHNLPSRASVSGLLGLNILKNFDILLKFSSKILEIIK